MPTLQLLYFETTVIASLGWLESLCTLRWGTYSVAVYKAAQFFFVENHLGVCICLALSFMYVISIIDLDRNSPSTCTWPHAQRGLQ